MHSQAKKPEKTQRQREAAANLITYQKDYISRLQHQLKDAQQYLSELKTR